MATDRPISDIPRSGQLRMAAVTNERDTNCQALASYVINTIARDVGSANL